MAGQEAAKVAAGRIRDDMGKDDFQAGANTDGQLLRKRPNGPYASSEVVSSGTSSRTVER